MQTHFLFGLILYEFIYDVSVVMFSVVLSRRLLTLFGFRGTSQTNNQQVRVIGSMVV